MLLPLHLWLLLTVVSISLSQHLFLHILSASEYIHKLKIHDCGNYCEFVFLYIFVGMYYCLDEDTMDKSFSFATTSAVLL